MVATLGFLDGFLILALCRLTQLIPLSPYLPTPPLLSLKPL